MGSFAGTKPAPPGWGFLEFGTNACKRLAQRLVGFASMGRLTGMNRRSVNDELDPGAVFESAPDRRLLNGHPKLRRRRHDEPELFRLGLNMGVQNMINENSFKGDL